MNLFLLSPEIALAATALAVVLLDLFVRRKGWLTAAALAGIAVSLILTACLLSQRPQPVWGGFLALDNLAVFFKLFLPAISGLIILASTDFLRRLAGHHGEYLALILISTLGMTLLAGATNLIAIFVALELTAIPIYALTGFLRDGRSMEAALKYVLLGGINSAVLLYGLALIFGSTGSIYLSEISGAIAGLSANNLWTQPGLILGLVLVLAAFSFKVAAIPFHMWAPDVYEGAPTPVTLLLSTGSKLAGFAVLLRLLLSAFTQPLVLSQDWGLILAVLSAVSMTLGNLLAIPQTNIKRLLAFSSIAHTGYILIALATLGFMGTANTAVQANFLFYLVSFAMAEVVAFTAVIIISRRLDSDAISDFAGLGKRAPWLAAALTIGLLSLIGLPPTAGFLAKFFVFSQAVDGSLMWLVVIAVLNTVISAYYYLRVAKVMWLDKPSESAPVTSSPAPAVVLGLAVLAVLFFGLFPDLLMRLAEYGAKILLP